MDHEIKANGHSSPTTTKQDDQFTKDDALYMAVCTILFIFAVTSALVVFFYIRGYN